MTISGLGNQTKPCLRAAAFMIFMTFMLFLYYFHDIQYYNFVDYSSDSVIAKNYNESDILEEEIKNGYVVWSPSCRIPNISAHHESIKRFVFKWKPFVCSHSKSLTEVTYNDTSRKHTLSVNKSSLFDYSIQLYNIYCCYSTIIRDYYRETKKEKDDDDNRFRTSKTTCFHSEIELPSNAEFIYVECKSKLTSKQIYKNVHPIVIDKVSHTRPAPEAVNGPASRDQQNSTQPSTNQYSVLLFGIDSISRLNFMRTMPQTFQLLERNKWLHLEGYTKMGDNTFPNLIAILTGLTEGQLRRKCWRSPKSKLDECPFIWKDYKNKSYITSYVEDTPQIGTFNYHKYGFLNNPTDYYTRPFMLAGEKFLKVKMDGGMDYCMGLFPAVEYLFQYVTDFTRKFSSQPYFNLFWTNSFSHNELNMPTVMDARVRRFLEDIQDYLNSTIVVFFSDHGMRFGKIRETFVGWLEERMPFIYFWIPPSFKLAYPEKYASLVANRNRLTSPYDLHATLQDIIHGSVIRKPEGCVTCDTLFKKAVWNRSCLDAGITSHWCTCSSEYEIIPTNEPIIVSATNFAVRHLNQYLSKYGNSTLRGSRCATLNLKKIVSVRSKVQGLSMFRTREFIIVFETTPNGAIFETTVRHQSEFEISNAVSRINAYGSQSSCVTDDAVLKKYCFCVKSR